MWKRFFQALFDHKICFITGNKKIVRFWGPVKVSG